MIIDNCLSRVEVGSEVRLVSYCVGSRTDITLTADRVIPFADETVARRHRTTLVHTRQVRRCSALTLDTHVVRIESSADRVMATIEVALVRVSEHSSRTCFGYGYQEVNYLCVRLYSGMAKLSNSRAKSNYKQGF